MRAVKDIVLFELHHGKAAPLGILTRLQCLVSSFSLAGSFLRSITGLAKRFLVVRLPLLPCGDSPLIRFVAAAVRSSASVSGYSDNLPSRARAVRILRRSRRKPVQEVVPTVSEGSSILPSREGSIY